MFAAEHVERHRAAFDAAGIDPRAVRDPAELLRLPVLTRDEVRAGRAEPGLRAGVRPVLTLTSSGTAGSPRTVHHDLASLSEAAAASALQQRLMAELIGRPLHRQLDVVPPRSSIERVHAAAQRNSIPRRRVERRFRSLLAPPEEVAAEVADFAPDVVRTYGSYLDLLVPAIIEGRLAVPPVISYTAEAPSPGTIRLVREELGLPLLSTYQAVETLLIGADCDQRSGYHLSEDVTAVHIVDASGAELADGVEGEVAISTLVNRATVLLNYRIGDRATLDRSPCPCGDPSPRLSYLTGRTDDWVALEGGGRVHALAVHRVFRELRGVRQYAVLQQEVDRFQAEVVLDPATNRDALGRRISAGFAARFGPDVAVEVTWVDQVSRSPGGKLRPFTSLVAARSPRPGRASN